MIVIGKSSKGTQSRCFSLATLNAQSPSNSYLPSREIQSGSSPSPALPKACSVIPFGLIVTHTCFSAKPPSGMASSACTQASICHQPFWPNWSCPKKS